MLVHQAGYLFEGCQPEAHPKLPAVFATAFRGYRWERGHPNCDEKRSLVNRALRTMSKKLGAGNAGNAENAGIYGRTSGCFLFGGGNAT